MLSSERLAEALSGQAPRSIGSKAMRGVMWTTIQSLVIRLSGFLVFLVLARLLAPAQFGLLAAAQVFIALSSTLAEAGFSRTLVQRPRLRAAHLDSALLVAGTIGVSLAIALVAAAPEISALYHLPGLRPVLTALAVVPVFTAISSVPESLLRRQLRFRSVAMRGMSSVVLSGVLGVGLALAGAGVWALVAQSISQVAIASIVLWALVGWRPSRHWEWDAIRELMSFGTQVMGISLLNFLNRRTGEFMIGILLGPVSLGLFSVGMKILSLCMDLLVRNVQKVALPVFSRVAEQPARLAHAYLRATGFTTFVAMPGFALLGLFGNQLTVLIFGEKWVAAGPLMSILAFIGPVQSVAIFNNSIMLATGHSRRALQWTTLTAVLNVIGFVVSAHFGIQVVAAVYVCTAWALLPIGLYLVRSVSAVRFFDQVRTFGVPFLGCAAMLVVVVALHALPALSPLTLVLVGIPLSLTAYLALTMPFRRDLVRAAMSQVQRRRAVATRSTEA
jgi:O-antigen/teichoic acid export membrane protein